MAWSLLRDPTDVSFRNERIHTATHKATAAFTVAEVVPALVTMAAP